MSMPRSFQPETLRSIIDSSRDEVLIFYRPVIPVIGRHSPLTDPNSPKIKVPRSPFRLFLNPDIDLLLLISAMTCALFYGVIATMSTALFEATYPFLDETTIGFCFLAIGGGMIFGSLINGRMLDLEYQRFKKLAPARFEQPVDALHLAQDESFPLEKVCSFCLLRNGHFANCPSQSGSPGIHADHHFNYGSCHRRVWLVSREKGQHRRTFDFQFAGEYRVLKS